MPQCGCGARWAGSGPWWLEVEFWDIRGLRQDLIGIVDLALDLPRVQINGETEA
jgi:hypothetical protein